jgi:hypothetical protein
MSFLEIDTPPPAKRPRSPRQFTLLGLLRLFVVVGFVCATAVWFDPFSAALLGVIALVLYFPRWAALPRSRKARYALVVAAAALVWVAMLLAPFLTGLAVLLPSALFLARTKVAYLLAFVVLTPMGPSFGHGVWDYCHGQAVLRTEGYPSREPPSLDRKTRCYWRSSGCVVRGHEWAIHEPYNHAVQAMTTLCGYMPGAYTGPYPSEAAAMAALQAATPVFWDDLLEGRVVLGDVVVPLDETVRGWLQGEYDEQSRVGISIEPAAVLWKEDFLLIQTDHSRRFQEYCIASPVVGVVVERKTGRPITALHDRTLRD